MRRDRQRPVSRPWRRREANPATDPARISAELQRRQLNDLEDCRTAWERGTNPLAVCVAVTKADLPEWLADALLVILTDEAEGGGPHVVRVRRRWEQHRRDAIDAAHAQAVAMARTEPALPPQTLEVAYPLAERFVRGQFTDVEAVGSDAVKKAYRRVCRRLGEDPGRYYAPPADFAGRLQRARERLVQVIEADLARQREHDTPAKE